MITSEEIKRRLYDSANELCGLMDAGRYFEFGEVLEDMLQDVLGFYVLPEYL